MLARGELDWSYIVAIIVLSLVSWIGNLIKKRAEKARSASGQQVKQPEQAHDEEFADAEVLADENASPGEPESPVTASQWPPRGRPVSPPPPPLAIPVRTPQPPPPLAPAPWSTRLPAPRGGLQEDPSPRIVTVEAPTRHPTAHDAGTRHPALRVADTVAGVTRAKAAPPVPSPPPLPGTVEPSALQSAIVRRLLGRGGVTALREAVVLAEIMGPPAALRVDPPTSTREYI